jgi:Fur family zinc uptake transcriptional regulator
MTKSKHNHDRKIDLDQLIGAVQEMSKARGERMTSVRCDVLAALVHLREPQGAYSILAEVNKKRKTKLSAMSLYRTLHFLIELGVVIKLDSQNSYKLCADHAHDHGHLMIVCDGCGDTKEVADSVAMEKLQNLVRHYGYTPKHHVVELHSVCAACHG